MAKTIAIVLAVSLLSIAPLAAFAQTNESNTNLTSTYLWFLYDTLAFIHVSRLIV
jgi:hypothetical protein